MELAGLAVDIRGGGFGGPRLYVKTRRTGKQFRDRGDQPKCDHFDITVTFPVLLSKFKFFRLLLDSSRRGSFPVWLTDIFFCCELNCRQDHQFIGFQVLAMAYLDHTISYTELACIPELRILHWPHK